MLTPAWTPLRFHAKQNALWRTKAKFCAVVAGRGSGKTEIARRRIIRYLAVKKPWPDPMYLYALPTYNQASRVAWKPLLNLIPPSWIKRVNSSAYTIETVFGSTLYVMGMDKPQRAEGVQWDGIVLDESSDQRPKTFDLSLLPAMSHRDPWCWRIGVPKRFGVGAEEFREFFEQCKKRAEEGDPNWEAYWWPSSDVVSPHIISIAKTHLDERDFREQYEASWETAAGAIFYAFDEIFNVRDDLAVNKDAPLIIGADFNVDPMCWIIAQQRLVVQDGRAEKHLWVLDEVFRRNTNTEDTLNYLAQRYGEHPSGFEFYGDASSRARKTAASSSDYSQIKDHPKFRNKSRTYFPNQNPLLVNRFAACNAMFKNAEGVRRCFIHPRCKNLIKDLKSRSYKPGSREPDDHGDIGHMSDALGYPIHRLFPVRHMPAGPAPSVYVA